MKHPKKTGKAIVDNDTKFIKKLLKKTPIIFNGCIYDKEDCLVEVTNIRKYENNLYYGSNSKFVFEVDVKVKKNKNTRFGSSFGAKYKNRRIRSYRMEKLFEDELCYFGIKDFCVSKISYE